MTHAGHLWGAQVVLTGREQGQAAARNGTASDSAAQHPPITKLLWHLSSLKTPTLNMEFANDAVAPLVRQLPFDQVLTTQLEKFGWSPASSAFTCTLNVYGLKAALQKYLYVKGPQLGCGSYGVVFKAMNRETGELVAIKKVANCDYSGLTDSAAREIVMLRELQHDNIISLKDAISTASDKHTQLVLDMMDCNLKQFLDQYCEASEIGCIKSVILQILRGVRHAHKHSIMHRDIKPQNVLVELGKGNEDASNGVADNIAGGGVNGSNGGNGNGRVPRIKITDFGLARPFLPTLPGEVRAYTQQVVTLHYRAPELLLGSKAYTPAVDLWSVGCIMAEMVNFEPLFKSDSEIGLLQSIFGQLGNPAPEVWHYMCCVAGFSGQFRKYAGKPMRELVPRLANDPAGLDLLSRLLDYDPRRRITARQALEHPWLHGVQV